MPPDSRTLVLVTETTDSGLVQAIERFYTQRDWDVSFKTPDTYIAADYSVPENSHVIAHNLTHDGLEKVVSHNEEEAGIGQFLVHDNSSENLAWAEKRGLTLEHSDYTHIPLLAVMSIGFLKMDTDYPGELRTHTPDFIKDVANLGKEIPGFEIWLEKDYGKELGFSPEDYTDGFENIHFKKRKDVFEADLVRVLKSYNFEDIKKLEQLHFEDKWNVGTYFSSMMHFKTRPQRNRRFLEAGKKAISDDSAEDEIGRRTVFDSYATAYNGVYAGLTHFMVEKYKDLNLGTPEHWNDEKLEIEKLRNSLGQIKVTVMGGKGCVGRMAVLGLKQIIWEKLHPYTSRLDENSKFREFEEKEIEKYIDIRVVDACDFIKPGGLDEKEMRKALLKSVWDSHIVVDATKRPDCSKMNLYKRDIRRYKKNNLEMAIDLAADPYDTNKKEGPSIQGIPLGNVGQVLYGEDDKAYDRIRTHRASRLRWAVSCNGWPGWYEEKVKGSKVPTPRFKKRLISNMEKYESALLPMFSVLLDKGYYGIDRNAADPDEYMLARAQPENFFRKHKSLSMRPRVYDNKRAYLPFPKKVI
ncbi:MAG: hypothetical protein KKF44_00450 [Nanoarchaeota archaeon]|nr:hypothetical protein [Nanoarchaeota archaeon]